MQTEPAMAEAALSYLMDTASVLALRLDAYRQVVAVNAHARQLLGPEVVGRMLDEVVVNFTEVADSPGDGVHLMTFNTVAGVPESFFFRRFPLQQGTLLLGQSDLPKQEH